MDVASVDERSPLRLSPVGIAAGLLGLTLVAWILVFDRMRGMDAGPGTDLGGLGWFLGIWVTMMSAMMLPSVAPMVLAFARVTKERARREQAAYVPTWIFLVGYLLAWTAYGVLAYGLFRVVDAVDADVLSWDRAGPYVAGGAVAVAGLYQLTPIKDVCLRHCRGPLHFMLHGWHDGSAGAVRMGFVHGLYCVGCCWGLMVVLFSLGVMSLVWMAVIAGSSSRRRCSPTGRG
jgi:predicted metal-binding membrane protein